MSEYYSLGDLTLSIGNFIEAFGSNVALESLSCGTPVIMSLVGAQRTTIKDENIVPKVAYDDLDETEELAFKILTGTFRIDEKKSREYIEKNFSHKKMLKTYEKEICSATILEPLKFNLNKKENNKLIISPWCFPTSFGIYDDYAYKYHRVSKKLKELLKTGTRLNVSEITSNKLKKEISELKKLGVFVEI